jgi:hypothetical protein
MMAEVKCRALSIKVHQLIRKVARSVCRRAIEFVAREVAPLPYTLQLFIAAQTKKTFVMHSGGPIVSLTTYGARIKTVHLVIESILGGSVTPSRILLWLDDKAAFENLPQGLRKLKARGVEVLLSESYGPHTKYFPSVELLSGTPALLVTADDDQLYPKCWLKSLIDANQTFPEHINCHMAKVVRLGPDGLEPYNSWVKCFTTETSLRHIALGVSGVIYPPKFVTFLQKAGDSFRDCCPKADDLWLHVQAVRAGIEIRQISNVPLESLQIRGSQRVALWRENISLGNNDPQMRATYTKDDVARLRAAH